jgi:hypothetical protein
MSLVDLSTYGGLLQELGYAGQIAEASPSVIDSRINESTGSIDFGIAVARGTTADNTAKVIAADGDLPIGISGRHAIRPADSSINVNYAKFDAVPVVRMGFVFVVAFENVVRGTAALSITAQGGKIASTTGGAAGAGRVAIPGAVWETTTSAGSVGIVRING